MELEVTPFKVHFSDEQIAALKEKVKAGVLPRPTYEGSGRAMFNLGVRTDWMRKSKDYWANEYQWRPNEDGINKASHYTALVPQEIGSPLKIHFIHERATKPNAPTVLLLSGWPGDFYEALPLLEQLKGEYNVVIPSNPGYTFSDPPPIDREFGIVEVAKTMHRLMQGLGYPQYVIQAGDWVRLVARQMSKRYPSSVVGVHYNMLVCIAAAPPSILHHYFPYLTRFRLFSLIGHAVQKLFGWLLPNLETIGCSEVEREGLKRGNEVLKSGLGYQGMHITRTSTIAHAIAANPLALLAWNGEKYLDWTDETPPLNDIMTHLTLWSLTDTFATSIYSYRHEAAEFWPTDYISTPTGYSYFAHDMYPVPRAWAERCYNIQFYKEHTKGGHFPAWEKPQELAADVKTFVSKVWPILN